ncbi:hypothetical protein WB66_12165 [bacteria symbiont BFo1 of Frankliniella occidentalis]|nr:hypothetical protein AI28_12515 [bacteria symbiont BFo1 of Frankliniella occidentalis]KYP84458.1 hypothetical protein WB66_12165 [bacteria symbiont BFo1 of Frankliniella occidentalis]
MAEKRQYKHPQFNLRIPEELKSKIEDSANIFKRSMNAQIVAVLDEYYENSERMRDCVSVSFSNEAFNESKEVREAFESLLQAVGNHEKKQG